jgi:ribosomal protein S12 methylthiotransferase
VVVNTCGFIDAAVEESLDAIGEALAENGKVIVTGCLGAKGDVVKNSASAGAGRHRPACHRRGDAGVHAHLPQPHDPFTSLVPPQGIRLTPQHYAYLKISEGCNHSCTFCIIPSLRGDAGQPADRRRAAGGEVWPRPGSRRCWSSRRTPAPTASTSSTAPASGVVARSRRGCSNCARRWPSSASGCACTTSIPYPSVDDLIPLMAEGKILPYLDVPFQHASRASSRP